MFSKLSRHVFTTIVLSMVSVNLYAESGREDYDLDDDGLIEINDLADLDEIRNMPNGSSLYGESLGCPESGCNGFELTIDLDFDTNGDGVMDERDTYWNGGLGWEPISTQLNSVRFPIQLDGNGHVIANLYINRPTDSRQGLFVRLDDSSISNLVIAGELTSISGLNAIGILAGSVSDSEISNIFVSGQVLGTSSVGGLAGYSSGDLISNVFSSANVTSGTKAGGLIGSQGRTSRISQSLSSGNVYANAEVGGLLGYYIDSSKPNIINSYWSTDTTGQETNAEENSELHYVGATLAELQCPTAADNTLCAPGKTLYAEWSSDVWDFGSEQQLPALKLNGRVFRDSDGDGVMDEEDVFPYNFAASVDTDGDGYPDKLTAGCGPACIEYFSLKVDKFPESSAAWVDEDFDGQPDEWSSDCDSNCQIRSGLTLDDFPDDSDNDGITNALDQDDTNDGKVDADSDSDGLIEIYTLEQLHAIRFDPSGHGRVEAEGGESDRSGCPYVLNGRYVQRCHGYELMADLDFDTNGDGVMDERDTYWNDSLGWLPIPGSLRSTGFSFDGNGHAIANLYINRPDHNLGLFSVIYESSLRNVVITGELTSISGKSGLGILVASASRSEIKNVNVSGEVTGGTWVGGLAGRVRDTHISNVFSSAKVTGEDRVGGLIGSISLSSVISQALAVGAVNAKIWVGGLSGDVASNSLYPNSIKSSYWSTDTTGQESSDKEDSELNFVGATLAELQCPTAADNTLCAPGKTLYAEWSSDVWDFGSEQQLPALKLNGRVFRDSDGDGVMDEEDALPYNFAASVDTDSDGYPDKLTAGCGPECMEYFLLKVDQLPESSAAWLDEDFDGQPDEWSSDCDSNCQIRSGLTLDVFPDDSDNDGVTNALDQDDTNNGRVDADSDSDGLIDIYTLEQLHAIRFDLLGHGRVKVEGGESDRSGCPYVLDGRYVQRCHGYELMADLDFDTNGDGVMDERDTYWNGGLGWEPISTQLNSVRFPIQLDGNGHVIANLYIDRRDSSLGLFSVVYESSLRNVVITGKLTSISGLSSIGILAGSVSDSEISNIFVSGQVSGNSSVGGLAGYSSGGLISNVFSSANVTSGTRAGGLIGSQGRTIRISQSLSSGDVYANADVGGLLGYPIDSSKPNIINSYWSIDTTGQETSAEENSELHYVGATLAELQCPTAADNTLCVPGKTLYAEWSSDAWDFGTNQQLPALIINGRVFRDSDGDGTVDVNNAPAVSLRLTQDGQEEVTIVAGEGDVTLEASVSGMDEFEYYTLEWSLNGIGSSIELGNTITFKSDDLIAGDYTLSVTATDSGYPRMSGSDELVVRVISDVDQAPSSSGGGSNGGGGSLSWYWLLLAVGLLRRREKLAV